MEPLSERAAKLLQAAGLEDVELIASTPVDEVHFGNTDAEIRAGPLFLRFVRDRGQEFMDVASVQAPRSFYQFNDVQVAFGWATTEAVFAREGPLPLEIVVRLLTEHWREVDRAFTRDWELTRPRLEQAAREREEFFRNILQGRR